MFQNISGIKHLEPLVGGYTREQLAHLNEENLVKELFLRGLSGLIMIDVGAYHGSTLMPFLNMGWKIFAFEPDDKNRQKLFERIAKHKNVNLVEVDVRAISNENRKNLKFYRSEQSTGISGLHAFHNSHFEAQLVDAITLEEFFKDKPLPAVNFLKIDTEGHDLFVLQGFPWNRTKPVVIECEFEDAKTVPLGYTFHDLAQFLVDKGYHVYVSEWHPVIRYGIRHNWNRLMQYPCELSNTKSSGNLLAFRECLDENSLASATMSMLEFDSLKNSNCKN